jgi:hypothetical protein
MTSIDSNAGLSSLDGAFPSLVASTTVRINNNANLLSMTGAFPKLTIAVSVEDGTNYQVEVTVGFNSQLQNMSHAFAALKYTAGASVNITIHFNGALADINSFHRLTTAQHLDIRQHGTLQSIRICIVESRSDSVIRRSASTGFNCRPHGLRTLWTAGAPGRNSAGGSFLSYTVPSCSR